MADKDNDLLIMSSIMDEQLHTQDGLKIGRVADIEVVWNEDGRLVLTDLITGPQALAARVSSRLRPLFHFIFRDRFEKRISIKEVENFGPTLHLKGRASDYPVGQSEKWLDRHFLRFIPGSTFSKEGGKQNQESNNSSSSEDKD